MSCDRDESPVRNRTLALVVSAAALAVGADMPAAAQERFEWQYATFIFENSALTVPARRWIESWNGVGGHEVQVEFFYQEALLRATAILPGVADGLADIGQTTSLYHPAELPLSQIASLPFLTTDIHAHTRAFNHLYDTNEAFRTEWDGAGVKVLSFVPITGNVFGTSFPFESLADLEGKRIRAAGLLTHAVELAGANAIAMAAPEIYQAMETGVLDGWTNNPFEVTISLGWPEVSPYFTDPGTGQFNMNVLFMNMDVWEGLPDDLRAHIEASRDDYVDEAVRYTIEQEAIACDRLIELGGSAHMLAAAEVDRWREMVDDSALRRWRSDVADRSV